MIPKHLLRSLVAAGLTATLLTMPITALAAVPAGWGADDPIPLPATVSPGANAGYEIHFYNSGPSTISQLYLFTVNGTYQPVYANPSQGSCDISGQLMCSLGQVKPTTDPTVPAVTIVVAFATPANATGTFSVDFVINTSGLGSGGGDSSHGDEIPLTGTTTISTDTTNYAGGFVVSSGSVIANAPPAGSNGQQTRIYPPAVGIPVTLEDGPDVPDVCPPAFTCVGETSEIHVGDGTDRYGLFKVVIEIDKTAFADVNSPNLTVIHVYDDGVTYDEITTACPKKGTPTTECATVSSGRIITITVWLAQNGFVKYH